MDNLNLQNRKQLKAAAKERLNAAEFGGKIALFYGAVIVGASLLNNGVRILLNSQISQSGGLQNLGFRSVLSTIQTMLPLILNFLLLAFSLGFAGSMLRIGRGQYASLKSIRIGFDRFWVLLRATLLKGGLYMLAGMASYILSMQIFFLTPMSRKMLSLLAPMMQGGGDMLAVFENAELLNSLAGSMIPLYILMGILFLAVSAPIYYRLVLVNYLLIDRPGTGALAAMRDSRLLMRGHAMDFFKLDISLWPYYLSSCLSVVILYGDAFLSMMGVTLPMSDMVSSLIFFALHLIATFLVTVFLQPHKEVTHALAYESLRPKEPSGGVVLGNIFDLARGQMDHPQ